MADVAQNQKVCVGEKGMDAKCAGTHEREMFYYAN